MKYKYYIICTINKSKKYLQAVMNDNNIEYAIGNLENAIEFGDFNSAYKWLNDVQKRCPDQDWKIDLVD